MPASTPNNSQGFQYVEETLVASAARTATGNSGVLSGFGKARQLRLQLDVSAASGTTPTLDVVVEDTLDGSKWFVIATFPQKTTNAAAATDIQNVTAPFSDRVRVRWTIGGTTPSFTFQVNCGSEADAQ